jgi:predicted amino acid dehydrogenase
MNTEQSQVTPSPPHYDGRFMFLVHFVETWNWLLYQHRALNRDPRRAQRWQWLWPLFVAISACYLLGRKAYEVADRFWFAGVPGETWIIRNFAWHFLLGKRWQEKIRQRILAAVLDAQTRGITVIGLGALTKAEWLTAGGQWIVETLSVQLHVPIVHGNTLTAATVLHRALELIQHFHLHGRPVFITGATSKIGHAVTLALASKNVPVVLYTASRERFEQIRSEAGVYGSLLTHATALRDGSSCGLWITGKAESGGKDLLKSLPHGAVVLNFAVPDPLSPRVLRKRPDVRHCDGGLLGYNRKQTTLGFTMRLHPGVTYACHAGTIVHAYKGWTFHEVGVVDLHRLPQVWEAAQELGFFLPPYTSFGQRPVWESPSLRPQQQQSPLSQDLSHALLEAQAIQAEASFS